MKIHTLIMEFLKENGMKLTERYLEDGRSRPKMIRFVYKSKRYSIVFSNKEPATLHLFKEKLFKRSPYQNVAAVHGQHKNKGLNYDRKTISVDLNDSDSFKQILDFL